MPPRGLYSPLFSTCLWHLEKYSAPCAWQASSTTMRLYLRGERQVLGPCQRFGRRYGRGTMAVTGRLQVPVDEPAGFRVCGTLTLEVLLKLRGSMQYVVSSMSTKSGRPPAWLIASVVAIKVWWTVTTTSPGFTPAAVNANRTASVPLATPTQCDASQNFANSRSNSSTLCTANEAGHAQCISEGGQQFFF